MTATSATAGTSRDDRAAIDKAVSLLAAFGDDVSIGVGVSELARRADLSKSTAFRVLGALERNGIVERVGTQYRIGSRLHDLGRPAHVREEEELRDVLTPFLAELYELTRETVHLAVLRGPEVVYLNKLYGHRQAPAPSRVGGRAPAYCTGVGKVLLAYDHDAIEAAIARGLTAWTPSTVSDPDRLREHLAQVRAEGIAYDNEEVRPSLTCVAVPVFRANGQPAAAFSVAGLTGRVDVRAYSGALRRISYTASKALQGARYNARQLRAV